MSVFFGKHSSKNIFNKQLSLSNLNIKIRSNSIPKIQNDIPVKSIYKKTEIKYNKNLTILNYIMECAEKNYSRKTAFSDNMYKSEEMKYDLSMLNRYEEHLNSSFSDISEFDLEQDENKDDSSFNSEEDDNCYEENIINIKPDKYNKKLYDEDDFDFKLEQDFNNIKKNLLSMK